jgi:hypothetical protein
MWGTLWFYRILAHNLGFNQNHLRRLNFPLLASLLLYDSNVDAAA